MTRVRNRKQIGFKRDHYALVGITWDRLSPMIASSPSRFSGASESCCLSMRNCMASKCYRPARRILPAEPHLTIIEFGHLRTFLKPPGLLIGLDEGKLA